jgi:hypothetical protein
VASITSGVQAALRSVYETFKPTLTRIKDFAFNVLRKVGEFAVDGAFKLLDSTGVLKTIIGLGDAISGILKDPKQFATNLITALQQGFSQFGNNIVKHLKDALIGWLFGELGNITPPKDVTFGSIFTLMLKVLKLDYQANLRPKLVKELGEEVVSGLEHAASIINTIRTKGLGAAWEEVKHLAKDLLDSFLTEARNWAITKVVQMAAFKIIQLITPGGAILEALRTIYTTVEVIIKQARKIQVLIDGIAKSISKIVAGQLGDAATFIENVLAGAIPVMINFLATYLNLGDIGETIRSLLKKLTDKIGAGVDKIIKYIADKGRALLAKGKETVAKVLEWWKARLPFKIGDEDHTLYLEGDGDHPQVMVESAPSTLALFLDNVGASDTDKTEILALAAKIKWRKGEVQDSTKGAEDGQSNLDKLYDRIKALKIRGVKLPESDIRPPSQKHKYGGATGIKAFLSLNVTKGTTPNKNKDPEIWEDLGSIREKKSYVRGHLLNDRLGGLGEWENLMPLTNKANGDYYRDMEKDVIEAVSTGKKLVWVEVEATYKFVNIPPDGTRKEKEEKAESRLGKLIWKYGPAIFDKGTWKKATGAQDKNQVKANSGEINASDD